MKFRAVLALALLGTVALLAPLAYANPTDPSWIAGFYDDADLDAIADFITSEAGVAQPIQTLGRPAAELVVTTVVASDQDPPLDPTSSWDAIRAPPSP